MTKKESPTKHLEGRPSSAKLVPSTSPITDQDGEFRYASKDFMTWKYREIRLNDIFSSIKITNDNSIVSTFKVYMDIYRYGHTGVILDFKIQLALKLLRDDLENKVDGRTEPMCSHYEFTTVCSLKLSSQWTTWTLCPEASKYKVQILNWWYTLVLCSNHTTGSPF